MPQVEGFLQLLSVNKSSPSLGIPDEIVSYSVSIKDDQGDFYTAIGEGFLQDLGKFSGTTYNHSLTFDNVLGSTSGNTWEDVWKYKMVNNNNRSYFTLRDFNLCIFAKTYWDAIWSEAGYSYEWPTLSGTGFDKLLIPYNGDRPQIDITNSSFKASLSSDTTYSASGSFPGYVGRFPVVGSIPIGSITNWYAFNFNTSPLPVIFNDDSTTGATGSLFDPGNRYNISSGIYTSNINGLTTFKTRYKFKIWLYNPNAFDLYFTEFGTSTPAEWNLKLNHNISGFTSGIFQGVVGNVYDKNHYGTYLNSSTYTLLDTFTIEEFEGIIDLYNNTLVRNFLTVGGFEPLLYTTDTAGNTIYNAFWSNASTTNPIVSNAETPQVFIQFIGLTNGSDPNYNINYFKNSPSSDINDGSLIELKRFIPDQIKKKDFISSIIKLFNLYICPTDKDKVLRIQTRDEYYDSGKVIDWTDKIVQDAGTDVVFLTNTQPKKMILSYKQDDDFFNEKYYQATSEVYGQLEYTFETDFSKEIKRIEPIFASTPLITNKQGLVIPAIDSVTPTNVIRVLYDGGNPTCPEGYSWTFSGRGTVTNSIFNTWPYAGHFDQPFTPDLDIDFGQNDRMLYDSWEYITDNNLFNLYYRRYFSQIQTGKLLKAKFRLTELDIINLDLRDKVWIHDMYYYINIVDNYDCNAVDNLTTVELITVEPGTRFSPRKTRNTIVSGIKDMSNAGGNTNNNRTINQTNTYGSNTSNSTVSGEYNVIQPNSSNNVVSGYENSVAGTSNIIQGDGNLANGNQNNIVGDDNIVL